MKNTKITKIKKGDLVRVMLGKDKGKEGKVEKVNSKNQTVTVLEVNLYKRHIKGSQSGVKAGIYDIPRPLNVAKLALICPNCKKVTRVGFEIKVTASGLKNVKSRVCKKCKKQI
jgi:large subunit ribosomal protein L24